MTSGNWSIPQKANPPSYAHDFASPLAASFQSGSPIAQEALARDLAEESDYEGDGANHHRHSLYDDNASDITDTMGGPVMYRRPSGVAYGTARPTVGPRPLEEPVLTHTEREQSRNEELSLLRDNHLLPPKHPLPEQETLARRIYKRLFSTKIPRRRVPDDDGGEDGRRRRGPAAAAAWGASETAPLLGTPAAAAAQEIDGNGDLVAVDEQWESAVAAGQIRTTWQREAKTIAVYSRSLVVTFLLQYSINVASIFAVGHIGKIELGAVSRKFFSSSFFLLL